MPYGYDFNVNPVQIESGTDLRARSDAAKARKIELQQRQIQLDEAKRQQSLEANQRAAAASAIQPQSYTPPAQSLDVGGADLGYQPATVQGPPQFNRGSYVSTLQKTNPLEAQQAQQQFASSDAAQQEKQIEIQQKLAALKSTDLENHSKQLAQGVQALAPLFQAEANGAPPDQLEGMYQRQLMIAHQSGVDVSTMPPNYTPGLAHQLMATIIPAKELYDQETARRAQDITMRGQDMTAQTAKAGQAVTMRGQNMVDARTKESNASSGSQVMQVPQPDGTVKLQRFNVGDALPAGAKTTAAAQKDEEAATVDEKKKADLVTNARENLAKLRDIAVRRPELFGPASGRVTSLRAWIGTNDDDIAQLEGIKDRFGMVNQGLHSMRSASHVAEAGDAVLNKMKNSASATISAIDEAKNSLDTFQRPVAEQRGTLSGNAAPSGATHAVIVGGKIIGYTADGKTMVPAK